MKIVSFSKILCQNIPYPAFIYLIKVHNRNTKRRYQICSKLTVKTPEQSNRHRSSDFIVNFEHISRLFVVFLLLTSIATDVYVT